mgnify:CR=1 FL=1
MRLVDIHVHLRIEDPLMDRHVEIAQEKGISALLVHGAPNDICPPLGDNEHILAAMNKHPRYVLGSMHVDLRNDSSQTIETIRRYAGEGFRCVKMYPNLGFDPADPAHDPVWEAIEEHGLMCLPHCGYISISPIYPKLSLTSLTASPFHFERAARMFPGIQFVMAHFGGAATYLETLVLCMRLANFHADCTPGQGMWVWKRHLPGIEDMPFDHFLWGTDEGPEAIDESLAFWNDTFDTMDIGQADRERFFGGNAATLLRLS